VDLRARFEVDELSFLEPLVDRPVPAGSLVADLAASDRDGSLGVQGKISARTQNGAISLTMHGDYGDLRRSRDVDVQLDLKARDLGARSADLAPTCDQARR
jgi:hypothetical protein